MRSMEERPAKPAGPGSLPRLLETINTQRGIDLSGYRARYLERRIAVRMRAVGVTTYRRYAERLDAEPSEYSRLLDALTINVTRFFRDESVHARLRAEVLPRLLEERAERGGRTIRVWSAGCATGEEPYSLAMTALDALDDPRYDHMRLQVRGTDVDQQALAVARRAEYPIAELETIPAEYRERFVAIDRDRFRITPEVTGHVRFGRLSLLSETPIHSFDIVCCRNVFIYFDRSEQDRMIRRFGRALRGGGYLVLGRSEHVRQPESHGFELVNGRDRIYRAVG